MLPTIKSNMEMDDKTIAERRANAISAWGGFIVEAYSRVDPVIASMSELELTDHFNPTPVDYKIRQRFWKLTDEDACGKVIDIYNGICADAHFYNRIMKNPYKISWVLTPMNTHQEMFEEFFHALLTKMRKEALNLPLNEKTFSSFVKTLEMLANRTIGPVVQKVEQKSMNVNVDGTSVMRDALAPDQLEQKFKELKSQLVSLPEAAINVEEPE